MGLDSRALELSNQKRRLRCLDAVTHAHAHALMLCFDFQCKAPSECPSLGLDTWNSEHWMARVIVAGNREEKKRKKRKNSTPPNLLFAPLYPPPFFRPMHHQLHCIRSPQHAVCCYSMFTLLARTPPMRHILLILGRVSAHARRECR